MEVSAIKVKNEIIKDTTILIFTVSGFRGTNIYLFDINIEFYNINIFPEKQIIMPDSSGDCL